MTIQFKVEKSSHRMNCITGNNLPKPVMRLVEHAVCCNRINTEEYKLSRNAGAFLQGFNLESGWLLVEFWQSDFQPFIDFINKKLLEMKPEEYMYEDEED